MRASSGFTIVELMAAVFIIGCLAAVAIPVYRWYAARSKTSEATQNLAMLYRGAATYYQMVKPGRGNTPERWHCKLSKSKTIPVRPHSYKQTGNFAGDDSFRDAGFLVTEPLWFSYAIQSTGSSCNSSGGNRASVYSFRAFGDLDDDNKTSLIELSAGLVDQGGDSMLRKAAVFYKEDEGE